MTCPKCTNGEILDHRGYTITTCDCLMGVLQLCLYIANTGGNVNGEVFGIVGRGDGDMSGLGVCV